MVFSDGRIINAMVWWAINSRGENMALVTLAREKRALCGTGTGLG